jgi:hypothetical protein
LKVEDSALHCPDAAARRPYRIKKGRPIERPFQLPQMPGQAVAGAAGFAAVLFALIAIFLRLM